MRITDMTTFHQYVGETIMFCQCIEHDIAHIDDDTPSLAIAVAKESRGKGIGTRLLNEMFAVLKDAGFLSVSLSVQKENFAVNMYHRVGFEVVKDNGGELVMRKKL